jgi:glycosyltransferase involved in cell wall biosynthesis
MADRVSVTDLSVLDPRFWTVLDVFCHAAKNTMTPRLLARAMAEGIPIVASRIKGIDRLVEDGRSGLLVPPDDPDAMASAIIRVIDDPDKAAALGRRGQDVIRTRFSLEVEADMLAELYRAHARVSPRVSG